MYYATGREGSSKSKSKGKSAKKLFLKSKKKSMESLKQLKRIQIIEPLKNQGSSNRCKSPQSYSRKPKQESSSQISSPRAIPAIISPQKKL